MLGCRLLVISALMSIFAFAQTPTASVVGRVSDSAGGVVPLARVKITNLDTNQSQEVLTRDTGDYTAPNLQAGRYSMESRVEGFQLYRRPEFTLALDQVLRLDIVLQLGAVTESVTVVDTPPALNTESGARGDVTTSEELREMPLAGRNFADLAYLTGGVQEKGEGADGGFAINGARADNTGYLIDGMNNTQRRNTGSMVSPPLEGVQEFKMITSGFAAEYGRYAGGVLSVVLKSGGNRLRGSLYQFMRNDVFDARNFFDVDKNKLRRHQFGATASGPVVIPKLYDGRNKTFFLGSWESLRQISGATRRGLVPLDGMINGDFTGAVDANRRPIAITDPLNQSMPFPGKRIPAARFDPVALKMAAYYPKANLANSALNYLVQGNPNSNWDNFSVKIDHAFSQRDQFSARTLWRGTESFDPFTRSFIPEFGSSNSPFELLTGLRYTRTLTPSLILEANASFSRRTNSQGWPVTGRDWSAEVGFTGGLKNPVALGLPQMEPAGYVILGHAYDLPKIWSYNNYQYTGNVTWIRGKHNLKLGGDFLRFQYFSRGFGDTRGRLTFLGRFTQEPFADFLMGYAQTSRRQMDAAGPYHLVSNYSAFVQDDYKITSTLTLNLGMRYDLMLPPREKFGAWSSFLPSLGKIAIAGRGIISDFDARISASGVAENVIMASAAGLPDTLVRPDRNDFAPRFGFAWRPRGGTKFVLRGGYGIFYGTSSLYRLDEASDTYPFSINETYSTVSSNPLTITVSNPFPDSRRRVGGITSTNGQDVNQRSQYIQSWSLTTEREIGKGSVLEVAFAGSKGTNLPRRFDLNQPDRRLEVRQADGTFPRLFPQFQTINYIINGSNSIYNSAAVTVKRRFSKKLFVRAAYTYAKSIDESSNTGGTIAAGFPSAQDSRNLHGERGRSDFDIGHSMVGAFIWEPSLGKGVLLKKWQVAGTTRAYTGAPFTPKVANVSLDLGEAVRPDRIASGKLEAPGVDQWFNRDAFPLVARGSYRYGSSGRNILDGPGFFTFDVSLSRRFTITEGTAMQFRWETFNLSNRANFNLPLTQVDVRGGATINTAKAARVHQVGLRLEF